MKNKNIVNSFNEYDNSLNSPKLPTMNHSQLVKTAHVTVFLHLREKWLVVTDINLLMEICFSCNSPLKC